MGDVPAPEGGAMNKAKAFARTEKEKKRQFALGRLDGMKRAQQITMTNAIDCFKRACDDEAGILRHIANQIGLEAERIDLLP